MLLSMYWPLLLLRLADLAVAQASRSFDLILCIHGLLALGLALNVLLLSAFVVHLYQGRPYEKPPAPEPVNLDGCSQTLDRASEELCCICLLGMGEGEIVSTLPCCHSFHRACL